MPAKRKGTAAQIDPDELDAGADDLRAKQISEKLAKSQAIEDESVASDARMPAEARRQAEARIEARTNPKPKAKAKPKPKSKPKPTPAGTDETRKRGHRTQSTGVQVRRLYVNVSESTGIKLTIAKAHTRMNEGQIVEQALLAYFETHPTEPTT